MSETVMRKKRLRVLVCSLCVILSLIGMGLFLAPMENCDFRIAAYPYLGEFSWAIDWPSDIGDAIFGTTLDNIEKQASTAKLQQCQGTETDEIQSEYTLILARPRQENRYPDPIINTPAVEIQRYTVTTPEYNHLPAYYQQVADMPTPIPLQELLPGEPHDPIFIDGDDDFDKQAKKEVWPGSGTEEDPYLIQSFDIDVGGDDRSCIEIRNIDKIFFRIRFCTLQGAAPDWRAGIHLYNVNYGRLVNTTWVSNNTCIGNCYGIRIDDAYSVVVANNTCTSNNWEGIGVLYESKQNMVTNNHCYGNGWSGIGVGIGASENIIVHNHCFINPQAGINLWLGIDNVLRDNDCRENRQWGIAVRGESNGNQVLENLCNTNMMGIFVNASSSNELDNNTCEENNIYGIALYYSNLNRLANNNCSRNDWEGIAVIQESRWNGVLHNECYDNGWNGIGVGIGASDNIIMHNHCFINPEAGINLWLGNDNILRDNNCSENTQWGIAVRGESNGNQVLENLCNTNMMGIFVSDSDDNTLSGNTCTDNLDKGIYLDSSNDNTLSGNNCTDNFDPESPAGTGIYLDSSNGNTLSDNTCNSNHYAGIYLLSSNGNTLSDNTCTDNFGSEWPPGIGIYLRFSNGNTLSGNTCINNFGPDWPAGIGIYLDSSNGNTLNDNTCNSNPYAGIMLDDSSNDNTLNDNTCSDNLGGIMVWNSIDNTLDGNTCTDNFNTGIYLDSSNGNTLIDNTCNNNEKGIVLAESELNKIYYDTCTGNDFGLKIFSGRSNEIWMCIFEGNSVNNVVDDELPPTFNVWSHNYYSDYTGPDNNGDGIGDTPYYVPGQGFNMDIYPLVYRPTPPRWLTPPTDLILEFGQRLALLNLDLDTAVGPNDAPVDPSTWWISDTEHFAINHEGRITDLMQLPVGTYTLEVQVGNLYSVYMAQLAPYGINLGLLSATFTITVVDSLSIQWSLELNGNFDYPNTEEAPIQIGALLTFAETGEPISGAYIELRIYDPVGNLLWTVTMSEIEPGVYLYRSPETIAYYVVEGIWQKGIYLVVGEASSGEGYPVHARSMIQYHIDPPSASGADALALFTLAGFGAVILLHSAFAGQYIWRKRRFNHRLSER